MRVLFLLMAVLAVASGCDDAAPAPDATPAPAPAPSADGGSAESGAGDSDAQAGTGTKIEAGLPDGGPDASATGWPSAANAGYKRAPDYPGTLTKLTGTIKSGQTYAFYDFADGLSVGNGDTHPTNVTFHGCRFASNALVDANVSIYGDGITFDYCTFEPSKVASPPTKYQQGYQYGIDLRYEGKVTVDHSDFWGWGNGIQFGFSSQAKPFVVKNTWFHDARDDGGIDHTDAILSNDGGPTYMIFDHNTIVSKGNTNGLALQVSGTPYSHVTITNNYFSGFGYTVNSGGNLLNKDMVFTGNTFGTDLEPVYGPLYGSTCWTKTGLGNTWRNNKWRITPGGYSPKTDDDGKFWWPTGDLSTIDYAGP